MTKVSKVRNLLTKPRPMVSKNELLAKLLYEKLFHITTKLNTTSKSLNNSVVIFYSTRPKISVLCQWIQKFYPPIFQQSHGKARHLVSCISLQTRNSS